MVKLLNETYSENIFNSEDLFICSIGYEQRSYYLYDKLSKQLNSPNMLIIFFDDYKNYENTWKKLLEIKKDKNIQLQFCNYENHDKVMEIIKKFIWQHKKEKENIRIHIDYSSMPRSWYCRLPKNLASWLEKEDKAFFWYVEGIYPDSYDEYPSAGIDSFSFFSGKPTIRTDGKRVHILSLGYDTVRTQALVSILDPESIIACNAYNTKNIGISEKVKRLNKDLIAQAIALVSLQLDDMSFMISKLSELSFEYQPLGDVILIPDGPKPLILAMSLIPDMVDLEGITCLHISRNSDHFAPIDVVAKKSVCGFSLDW